jgi:hypothetical protein
LGRTLVIIYERHPIAGGKLDGSIPGDCDIGYRLHVIIHPKRRTGGSILLYHRLRTGTRIVIDYHDLIRKPVLSRQVLEDGEQSIVTLKGGHTNAHLLSYGAHVVGIIEDRLGIGYTPSSNGSTSIRLNSIGCPFD